MSPDCTGDETSPASRLCISCGLCCRGIIFNRAALKPEERGLAMKHGLEYFSNGDEGFAFSLPCRLFREEGCPIYLERLSACKRYKCNLLKRVISGETALNEGLIIVSKTRSIMDSIEQISDHDGQMDLRQKVQKLLNLQYKNQINPKVSSALLKDIESLYIILHQCFDERAG